MKPTDDKILRIRLLQLSFLGVHSFYSHTERKIFDDAFVADWLHNRENAEACASYSA